MLDRLSIRWRLALISAALTFLILSAFALGIGQLTAARVRSDFNAELKTAANDLADRLEFRLRAGTVQIRPDIDLYAAANDAVIRVLDAEDGSVIQQTEEAPELPFTPPGTTRSENFRVETRATVLRPGDTPPDVDLGVSAYVQYARRVSDLESTVARVRFFLLLGVLGGTGIALAAGLLLARRAIAPITALTATARHIARTRDPSGTVPQPHADDEVAELARTLDEMLKSLEASREETEDMLRRQREFVADASHELRTPLTSVLANLELLADVLDGERGEAARSALRSSQRMRRLVGDLLLLARADAKRVTPHAPTDVGQVVVEAAAELGPVADGHELVVDARPAVVDGARDELHRMALNLMENAIRHTPAGTHVQARVGASNGEVVMTVEDDGPGVPEGLRGRVFERFVRGSGDKGSSSGLGLSIVRAVAESHGGSVALEDAGPGARFVVRLPRAAEPPP